MKNLTLLTGLGLGLVVVSLWFFDGDGTVQPADPAHLLSSGLPSDRAAITPAPDDPGAAPASSDSAAGASSQAHLADQLAVELLERYGETIHQRQTQARLLEDRNRIVEAHPQNGLAIFRQAVWIAFPDLAEAVLETVQLMAEYERWLEDNRLALNDLSILERQGALSRKRQELFGPDAELIWTAEGQSLVAKQRAMQAAFDEIGQSGGTLDEKLFQLKGAIDDTYGHGPVRLAIDPGTVALAYFGMESVQAQLQAMEPAARQAAINRSRRALGYSETQIDRMAERDQKSNESWQAGYEYMAERRALAEKLSGAELEQRLDDLRQKHFAHAAETIALEEGDGFFRFERPRVYGRN